MNVISIICCFIISTGLFAQTKNAILDFEPDRDYDNILVKKVYTDTHTSTFVIWIKKNVKPHKHIKHTEQVLVLEGKASVQLNDKEIIVQKGDWVTIPEQTIHAVKVLSKIPLKVISVQTPEFKGEDRVFID
ncbi:mannose-6-phosphate isomerase-like protein (cupin superfamily) [Aquimarina sp. EL_43]|uniref:cupin domain-containing protein n=1 Tax=Aquimarina TaxID=290174 RepID=UPI0004707EB8|nr:MULTISPECIES: cupin domain-containing protein [Aquimarina]MBG6129654.1 mannose-6-phosphate isomerase-like protein (cupin superfamily) [Aquimarina sp. EL_35]MBG6150719.1 mannose-6-phosphate isomerase-like protein (cupin superfamily) [Aquimarina sp. EL_32]MBG6167974.1 mannose-6-phosphate isomerase-like protein (cupin superfamily) [Aquimarina sp. EL_43]